MDTNQFLSEFRHIAAAPGGIQRLRQMIYNLAITGELTRQLADDGDAESLLHSIKSAKTLLLNQKAFKRSPKLENQQLLLPTNINLPDSWRWSRLVDIGEINPKNEVTDDTLTSFIPMSGVPQLHLGKLEAEQRTWGNIKKGFTHFADGDVVLAKITPCFENGKAAVIAGLTNGIGAGTTELHVVRPLRGFIEPAYVYFFLRSPYFVVEGRSNMTGTAGQKRLPTEYFATRAFPLPPFAEQKRIVAKVNELMALCDTLETQQHQRRKLCSVTRNASLEALVSAQSPATLQQAWRRIENELPILLDDSESVSGFATAIRGLALHGFLTERGPGHAEDLLALAHTEQLKLIEDGKIPKVKGLLPVSNVPYELPTNWRWARLHQVAEAVDPNPSHRMPKYVPNGVPFISTENFAGEDKINFEVGKQVSKEELMEHISRYEIRDGSFAFSRIGTIGKTCHLPKQRTYCISHALVVISVLTKEIDERYLRLAVSAEATLKQAHEGVKSIGVPDLGMAKIRNFLLPIPPLEEQWRIVLRVGQLMSLCSKLEADIGTAKDRASALALALTSSVTGIRIEDQEKMKAPKTEVVSTLRIGISPTNKEQAPLASILVRNQGELPAKTLWGSSGLEIEDFYQQLRNEMAKGWIVQPEAAYVREVEAG